MSILGELMRDARTRLGISQPKLAALLGLQSDAPISKAENGKRRLAFCHLRDLAAALHLRYDDVCRAWIADLETQNERKDQACPTQNRSSTP